MEGRSGKQKTNTFKRKPWIFTTLDLFSANIKLEPNPLSYEEALQSSYSKEWQVAINSEFQSLIKSNTWELTTLPFD